MQVRWWCSLLMHLLMGLASTAMVRPIRVGCQIRSDAF